MKGEYIVPIGRLAQVNSIQQYSKHYNPKVEHHYKKGGANPRYMKKDEYKGYITEYPMIHHYAPKLLNGKVKTNFKQKDIFDIDNSKPKKIPKPKFKYMDEKTGRFL